MQKTRVWSLGGEDLLEKKMATHSSILAQIAWTEEPGWLRSMGCNESDTAEQLTHRLVAWTEVFRLADKEIPLKGDLDRGECWCLKGIFCRPIAIFANRLSISGWFHLPLSGPHVGFGRENTGKKHSAVHPYSSCFLFVIFQCSVCSTIWNYFPLYIYIYIYIFFFFFSWPCCTACGILVPPPGMEPTPLALEAWSLNHNHQGSPWNCLQWFCPVPNTQSHKYWRVLSLVSCSHKQTWLSVNSSGKMLGPVSMQFN